MPKINKIEGKLGSKEDYNGRLLLTPLLYFPSIFLRGEHVLNEYLQHLKVFASRNAKREKNFQLINFHEELPIHRLPHKKIK